MSAPTNIRIQRLQTENELLKSRLLEMTNVAEKMNVQLNRLYLALGHTRFNEITNTITKENQG